ncbi:DNA (cytosine-5)-methyltransferase 3C [Frankliniella fusca]|uniref:DNA (cytosine-5-)-methyltransferase n=1 Tax=Frankliniella fusca TaxID=407009 RepID=A0AAE1LAD2_9NEOP|nr:DNA (cytosine-5)-methyltransferase 3C [Frankliniella fusca]KAK3910867.1 DNA (cytosine-5)-methyltransferase 3C [Frankliniella fusca]KAK3924563.1 DNA (cytosine-5)-methyltransferase 3C [Frankliniella fusca]
MPRKKVRLTRRKHSGTPSHCIRDANTRLARQLHNAALKYNSSVPALKDCKVVMSQVNLTLGRLYQNIEVSNMRTIIKRPRVLSLFDGISSGLVALNQLGIIPHSYYSSEIDADCIKLQRFNHPGKVTQLGNICNLDYEKLKELGTIDLLFAGSPCNDLSVVNCRRKGLLGKDGTGPLFFEFVRILYYFKNLANMEGRDHDFFWFFENTCAMEVETKNTISRFLGCQPLKVCASSFVPMKRKRYFWTNLPVDQDQIINHHLLPVDDIVEHAKLQDFLLGSGRKAQTDVLPTFTSNKLNMVKNGMFPVVDDQDGEGHVHLSEIESLFGLPSFYTAGPDMPLHSRKRMLAKCWDVHSVKFLMNSLISLLAVKTCASA